LSASGRRVEVALPLPIHRTFTYGVDGALPPIGTRVLVPFRRTERIGWVVGPGEDGPIKGLRKVLSVLDREPTVTPDVLELCRWMADYYVSPLGIALRAALPAVLSDVSRDYVTWVGETSGLDGLRPRERKVADYLSARAGAQRVATLRRSLGMGSIWTELRALEAAGLLDHEAVPPAEPSVKTRRVVRVIRNPGTLEEREDLFGRAGRQREAFDLLQASGGAAELAHLTAEEGFSRSVVTGLQEKGLVEVADEEEIRDPFAAEPPRTPPDLVPTRAQRAALTALTAALDEERPSPFLLQGITGSGKTLVYIELLREVLARGRTGIVLVPEISLTPQTVSRFRAHFGDEIAVLHSGLSDGERYDAWRLLRSGERRVAVGARSALFAPLDRLGLVVVDEEHDGSYKQSEAPRYQARDLAVVRARAHGAVCVLGSATPSLESRHNVDTGKFRRLELPERAGGASLPEVRVVDLREARRKGADKSSGGAGGQGPGAGIFSPGLVEAVEKRLKKGEQVILLLNRRGYSSFVQCRSCGEVERCENCSVSLTYHRVTRRIVCHHCRFEAAAPARCPRCGSDDLSFRGVGTEQVERVAVERFPGARIARMDVDTTSGKWAHQRILDRVERREVDILLGTQMIAKGLDFPNVTLVGVVNADVGLHLPDFRASERTFQLLSQVAGRAGRGALGGEVLIQTSMPEHYAVRAAVAHDYEGFAARELEERSRPRYPPHVRLANVVLSSPDQELVVEAAEGAARWLKRKLATGIAGEEVELVGPAPAPIERLHGRWRWHFLLRTESPRALGLAAHAVVARHRLPSGDVRLALDRDPVALL
jgi:primosomal protein N' (replication factor Y) (superfamily II helicase)